MVSLFKEKKSSGVFLIIVLSVMVHAHFFVHPPAIILPDGKNVLYYLLAPIQNLPTITLSFLYHAIIIIQALLLNSFANSFRLYQQPNFVVAMCFVVFSGIFPQWQNIDTALLSNFLIIFLLLCFARLHNTNTPPKTIFNCGIILGIVTIIFPPAIGIILIGLIAILIMRSFRLNEIVVYLIAVVFPYYLLFGILFLSDKLYYAKSLIPVFNFHIQSPKDKFSFLIASAVCIFSFLTGFVYMQQNTGRLAISARKLWIVIFLYFIIMLGSVLFISGETWVMSLMILLCSLALIASNIFYYNRSKFLSALLFWALIVVDILLNFNLFSFFYKAA